MMAMSLPYAEACLNFGKRGEGIKRRKETWTLELPISQGRQTHIHEKGQKSEEGCFSAISSDAQECSAS